MATRQKVKKSSIDPLWYKEAILYELRVRSFYDANGDGIGDFAGLTEKLSYLQDLGVTALWLLPFYPSPMRDDGYDISDYCDVHADVGTLDDFKEFLDEAHNRGLRVITELILNHTSDQHPWFQRARKAQANSVERNFYVWSDTPEPYQEARIIFKDFERSNWTWDPIAKAYFWHRFFSHQPDLNFDNKAVKKAILKVVDFWLGLGVDGLRLDAVPYLYEREGTNCENLAETFAFLEELRRHVDQNFEDRMLLAEANQWPEDAVRYLEGGNKCHMAYHFPIMPRMFMALHMEDRFPITEILSQTPAIPDNCQWGMFLRNHDELTLEMVTDDERDYMYEAYAKDPHARINLGIRRRLAPLLNDNRRKIELLNMLLFSLPGTPIIYYGDEIGMGDNVHLGDRNGVRTPMQWSADRNAGFSRANTQRLFLPVIVDPEYQYESINVETQQGNLSSPLWWMKRLIALRKQSHAFGRGSFQILEPANHSVFAFIREYNEEKILVVANLSRYTQYVELDLLNYEGYVPIELFGRVHFPIISHAPFVLTPGPHTVFWFFLEHPQQTTQKKDVPTKLAEISINEGKLLWDEKDRRAFENIIVNYIQTRRWFGGKARKIKTANIVDIINWRSLDEPTALLIIDVNYNDGLTESYNLPVTYNLSESKSILDESQLNIIALIKSNKKKQQEEQASGRLIDATLSDEYCHSLLQLFERKNTLKTGTSKLYSHLTKWLRKEAPIKDEDYNYRLLTSEQSNTSIIYNERLILKLFRRSCVGRNPDLEISRFLTEECNFAHTPKVAGWIEYSDKNSKVRTLASLSEYIPNTRDAWSYAREEIKRYFERILPRCGIMPAPVFKGSIIDLINYEPLEIIYELLGVFAQSAGLLGRRTAELHLALSANTENEYFTPESYTAMYQRSVYQTMRNQMQQVIRQLKRNMMNLTEPVHSMAYHLIASEKVILNRFDEFKTRKIKALRIRNHGDYHLGQVLYTGKDFYVIDFEGEPMKPLSERLRKHSPIRDVASMIRSFYYAAAVNMMEELENGALTSVARGSIGAWAEVWAQYVTRAFLKSYVENAAGACFMPKDQTELLTLINVYIIEKALYEVSYELNNRPSWLRIPLSGIFSIIERKNNDQ
ncbi:MAG: maltose alpha-D-glucosyltransferase [Deltaproteobacteria bacterium]|nr:maltose alpha-D-glucosyltransferase [Deltaproteobacteria bacterium]